MSKHPLRSQQNLVGQRARSRLSTGDEREPARGPAVRLAPWVVGPLFVLAGAYHFIKPAPYIAMMPPWLPAPATLVFISGLAEIAGGLGVMIPRFRRPAAWGLIALLIAVFPANLHVALHGWPGVNISAWILWLRLPFQFLFIWIVHRAFLTDLPPSRD